jgi:hypothetical protein
LRRTTTNVGGMSLTALADHTLHYGHSDGGYDVSFDVGNQTRVSCTGWQTSNPIIEGSPPIPRRQMKVALRMSSAFPPRRPDSRAAFFR